MRLETQELRIFAAVVENNGFKRAADKLHISHLFWFEDVLVPTCHQNALTCHVSEFLLRTPIRQTTSSALVRSPP